MFGIRLSLGLNPRLIGSVGTLTFLLRKDTFNELGLLRIALLHRGKLTREHCLVKSPLLPRQALMLPHKIEEWFQGMPVLIVLRQGGLFSFDVIEKPEIVVREKLVQRAEPLPALTGGYDHL